MSAAIPAAAATTPATPAAPTVSIVIPVHNKASLTRQCLNALLAEETPGVAREIVVVDDGSTDKTTAIARGAAAEDPRVRLLSMPNGGVAKARNAGSRGRFIAPVDADDIWHPEKIARQMEVMVAGGPEMGFVYTLHRGSARRDSRRGCVSWSPNGRYLSSAWRRY